MSCLYIGVFASPLLSCTRFTIEGVHISYPLASKSKASDEKPSSGHLLAFTSGLHKGLFSSVLCSGVSYSIPRASSRSWHCCGTMASVAMERKLRVGEKCVMVRQSTCTRDELVEYFSSLQPQRPPLLPLGIPVRQVFGCYK
jgi:hypothetical protein